MGTRPKRASRSFSVSHSSIYRLVVLILVLFSFLPRGTFAVTFARASSPLVATEAISGDAASDFILGPQAATSSSWFDNTEIDRGKFHGRNFPDTPPTGAELDTYIMANYYDLGMGLAIAYRRTGDPEFLSLFRKVEDSWWKEPHIKSGTVRTFDTFSHTPRNASLGGLILRAIDGRPEMWDWINAYTRYQFDAWLKSRINDSGLYLGVRDGAFMLQYATWLAKVLPDTFPLQAGGTATNGAALRAQYLADIEAISVNYFGRLQYPDGSWRWDDPYYTDADGGTLKGITQPFMIGLLLDALIDVYQITTNATVKTTIQNQVTKACRHLYSDGPYSRQRLSSLNVNLRGFHYFYHGGTTVNPTKYENGDLPANWNPTNPSDVQNQRQPIGLLVAAYGWSYQMTGDPFFKTAGDELWDSAYGPTDGIRNYMAGDAKSYNQNCRWAGSYLVWAGQPSNPSPTPTPTPTPSGTPTPTPTPTPTATPTPTGTPLAVSITSPANNSTFNSGANINVTATASSPSGSITRVDFYDGSNLIGTSTTAPYGIVWSNGTSGSHSVTAIARDNTGNIDTSNAVTVKISKSLNGVRSSKRNASTLTTGSNSGGTTGEVAEPTDFDALANGLEQTYYDFADERNMFNSSNTIDKSLLAALLLARSSASLARQSASAGINDRLDKIDAYLSICEDLMVRDVVSNSTLIHANHVNASLGVQIPQPVASSIGSGFLLQPTNIGRLIVSSSTPFTAQTLFSTGTYELGGVSVSINGQAAALTAISPNEIIFTVPTALWGGLGDVVVTSREGYMSHGTAAINGLYPFIFRAADVSNDRGAVLDSVGFQSAISAISNLPFNLDGRSRMSIWASGISTGVANSNTSNDVILASGRILENVAEGISVEARLADGRAFMLPVEYAGPQGSIVGLDQINVVLVPELRGAGNVQLTILVGLVRSNTMRVVIQ